MHLITAYSCLALLLLPGSSYALKEKCKEEDLLQRCSMALPVLSSPEISFALTKEELDKSCVDLHSGIKCISNYTELCMEKAEQRVFRSIYSGITGVVDDLCKPGDYQEEYLRHAACVKNVREEYEACSQKYDAILAKLSSHESRDRYSTDDSPGHEREMKTVCCSFQEYLKCSEVTVQNTCGDEAAVYTSNFLKRMSSNIIRNYCYEYKEKECGTTGKSSVASSSIYLISLVFLSHIADYITGNFLT